MADIADEMEYFENRHRLAGIQYGFIPRELMGEAAREIKNLRALVKHCWIHSGYPNCGYDQMTTEQKAMYDAIVQKPSEELE